MTKKEAKKPTPQAIINQLLGTSNKAEQLERLSAIVGSKPVTLVITANPINGEFSMSSLGSPSFKILYDMLDFARDGIMERERRALLEAASQENNTDSPE
jgi:hypothetical protein